MATTSNYTGTAGTRSSPPVFDYDYPTSGQGPAYTYHMPTQEYDDHPHVPSMNPQGHMTGYDGLESRSNPQRSSSPYNKSSQVPHTAYVTHQPISPTSPEEPATKKKRKRADPGQLKVLNETYNRTAFPSTEERVELAKALDMSARSVQIWCGLSGYDTSHTPLTSHLRQVPEQEAVHEADQPSVFNNGR